MKDENVHELLYEDLETEMGGVRGYWSVSLMEL